MEDFNRTVLTKLAESFDDLKERLIRIEENVKDVKSTKGDVENLKIQCAALEASTASAHKRIDNLDNKTSTTQDLDKVEKRVKLIEDHLSKGVWIVLTLVIVAILGTVIITK